MGRPRETPNGNELKCSGEKEKYILKLLPNLFYFEVLYKPCKKTRGKYEV